MVLCIPGQGSPGCPDHQGTVTGGWFEHRVPRRQVGSLRHQPGQDRRSRELLELDLGFAANMPGWQCRFKPVETRFRFMDRRSEVDARMGTKPEQSADFDRVVVVVDRPVTSPVHDTGFLGEQARNIGSGGMTSRGEKFGNPCADGVGKGS